MTLEIVSATTPDQLDAVRGLMQAFVDWHLGRNGADRDLVERYFDAGAFEEELASLPGKYAPPHGRLLLAELNGQPVGCVALRALDAGACEMKRMFVPPAFHSQGVGRALAEAVIDDAKAIGYTTMRLDTSREQHQALGLYRSLGFVEIAPYYDVPPEMVGWLVYMELPL